MAGDTKIAWADSTVNPWIGCAKVAPECDHCYAATLSGRYKWAKWGPREPRRVRIDAAIKELRAIARRGDREGKPRRVFIGSLCDVLDNHPDVHDARRMLFAELQALNGRVIAMLLSKRIGNANRMMPNEWRVDPPPWIWWGTSAGTQERWDSEAPKLLDVSAAVRFVSAEPMLGAMKIRESLLSSALPAQCTCGHGHAFNRCPNYGAVSKDCHHQGCTCHGFIRSPGTGSIDWVIAGCEKISGRPGRPAGDDWFRSLRDALVAAGVPYFLKQAARGGRVVDLPELDGKVWDQVPGQDRRPR